MALYHSQTRCHVIKHFIWGSIENDSVVSEFSYTRTILQRNYRKMTIYPLYKKCFFFYNSFGNGHFPIIPLYNSMAKFESHRMTMLYPNPCYNEVCYKGMYCIFIQIQ